MISILYNIFNFNIFAKGNKKVLFKSINQKPQLSYGTTIPIIALENIL